MSDKPTISLTKDFYKSKKIIALHFPYSLEFVKVIRRVEGATWSQSNNYWYILEKEFKIINLKSKLRDLAHIDTSGLHKTAKARVLKSHTTTQSVPKAYTDHLIQKRYSKSTYNIYTSYFQQFLEYFSGKDIKNLHHNQINDYLLELIKDKNISASQQNQRINAIKFYYEKVLGQEKTNYEIKRPKKERRLPTVLSKDEVLKILNSTNNLKHRTVLTTIYSGGLRRSELINLKVEDIDSGRKLIKICASKGKKDRYTLLSDTLLLLLREYYNEYRPKIWLFEGMSGNQYSATSIENVFRKAVRNAGIKKYVTPHSLRHSFATHLLEQGTNLRYIQEILGHQDSKTTEIYTHVANNELGKIKNPLDP
ncbi:MAG: site-specific integrase [Bacteroidales bacterium]|nr:site-specific integrase [Bacteroidales bacterium]